MCLLTSAIVANFRFCKHRVQILALKLVLSELKDLAITEKQNTRTFCQSHRSCYKKLGVGVVSHLHLSSLVQIKGAHNPHNQYYIYSYLFIYLYTNIYIYICKVRIHTFHSRAHTVAAIIYNRDSIVIYCMMGILWSSLAGYSKTIAPNPNSIL